MAEHVYHITVMGDDFVDGEWAYEHEFVCDIPMGSEKEAVEYLLSITKEQALEWECESGRNGLDIVVYVEKVDENGAHTYEFYPAATCEWIGDKLNGVWLGDGEERIDPIVKE